MKSKIFLSFLRKLRMISLFGVLSMICFQSYSENKVNGNTSTINKSKIGSVAITNVRVFDGNKLSKLKTVVIENGVITSATKGETVIDGQGGTLLPGFIDSHVHLEGIEDLEVSAQWGVTTMLDMGTRPEIVKTLRDIPKVTDIRSSVSPASAPGSLQTTIMGFDPSTAVVGSEGAEKFVTNRISEGSDYIKIIVEDPNVRKAALSSETLAAIVKSAHAHGLRTYAHFSSLPALQMAIDSKSDIITHSTLDGVISEVQVKEIVKHKTIIIPTLVMQQGIAGGNDTDAFHNAKMTVTALHNAKVPILVGTDSNTNPKTPFQPKHGESLHEEMALLVQAGLTPVEALRGATILPAQLFDLKDRGAIKPGLRADLVLIDGDPTKDINVTRNIKGVWIKGERVR